MHVLAQAVISRDISTQAIPRKAHAQSAISAAQTLSVLNLDSLIQKEERKRATPSTGLCTSLWQATISLNTKILIMQRPVKRRGATLANSASLHGYNKTNNK